MSWGGLGGSGHARLPERARGIFLCFLTGGAHFIESLVHADRRVDALDGAAG
jgi:hypothetical protein